jgi:stearoyl-CoA desaturase (delta-9 desaturase)
MVTRSDRTPTWSSIPFLMIHVVAIAGVFVVGFSWQGLLLAIALYYLRMFAVTGGYHRYFAHRTYKTSRVFHTLLAALAQSSCQKGVLWWASHHRTHHKFSDQPKDVHSAKLDGFWWSHVGWIVSKKWERTDETKIRDLAKYPELRFMDRFWYLAPIAYSVILYALGGWFAFFWGFFVSTVLLWHGTFAINSLTHMFGRRRFATSDNSKNSFILAIVCMGEGWHNNHHFHQRSANQGFYWWEIDLTFYVLRLLEALRIVWDVRVYEPEEGVHMQQARHLES